MKKGAYSVLWKPPDGHPEYRTFERLYRMNEFGWFQHPKIGRDLENAKNRARNGARDGWKTQVVRVG